MSPTPRRRIASLAVLLALGVAAVAQAAVGVGAALPDATFKDLAGNAVRTADLRGKPTIIAFWATWCTSCKAELEHLETVRAAHGEAQLRILAVSVDEEREDLDDFLASHSYPFPVYHDPTRAAAARFADEVTASLIFCTAALRATPSGETSSIAASLLFTCAGAAPSPSKKRSSCDL